MPADGDPLKAGKSDEMPATESEGGNGTAEEVKPGIRLGKVILLFLVRYLYRLSNLLCMSKSNTLEWHQPSQIAGDF